MPRYFAEGTESMTVPWSIYLVLMGHLALVICRTWHLEGLKLMSHRFSQISSWWRSFCSIIDSPSETKLHAAHPDSAFMIDGFQKPFRKDQKTLS